MGDLGYLDKEGKLWFCGRKTHRLQVDGSTIACIPQESIYNEFVNIQRCALVGPIIHGQVSPTLIVQGKPNLTKKQKSELSKSILEHDSKNSNLLKRVLFKDHLPVDIRHNIKIDRLKLKNEVESGVLS
jgi:acyl-coenzyme A synthetase/AMP-(fatty) acid ligase